MTSANGNSVRCSGMGWDGIPTFEEVRPGEEEDSYRDRYMTVTYRYVPLNPLHQVPPGEEEEDSYRDGERSVGDDALMGGCAASNRRNAQTCDSDGTWHGTSRCI